MSARISCAFVVSMYATLVWLVRLPAPLLAPPLLCCPSLSPPSSTADFFARLSLPRALLFALEPSALSSPLRGGCCCTTSDRSRMSCRPLVLLLAGLLTAVGAPESGDTGVDGSEDGIIASADNGVGGASTCLPRCCLVLRRTPSSPSRGERERLRLPAVRRVLAEAVVSSAVPSSMSSSS